ncbi:hypothetical protein ACLQ24_26825, partial [Micromonospora sp. DT4]|uniref:hypothetical protein n=1 Tax=Micromonospora sp. DT4 TaxID=3393438 RepID=UPI003CEAD126
IKAGNFHTAELFKTNNAHKLDANEKISLANTAAELAAVMPHHHQQQQLHLLVTGILECPPKAA